MTGVTPKIAKQKENPTEILARQVDALARASKIIAEGRINQKGIIILLQAQTGLPQKDIKAVLEALPKLEKEYLK